MHNRCTVDYDIYSFWILLILKSYARSQPARKDATSQNLLRQSFIAYSGAREEEHGRERQRGRERERHRERGRERGREGEKETKRRRDEETKREEAKRRREKRRRDEERECQNPVPFKENYPPPRTYHSLIGCSPSTQLSSRERQSTWRENCPCTCADYLLLRTQLSAPSCNGKCECGSPHSLKIVTSLAYSRLSQNLTLLPPRILPRVELSSLVHCIVQPLQLFPFMILLPTVRKLNYSRDDTLSCNSSPAASSRLQGCIGRNGTHPSHFISTFAIKHLSFDQEIDWAPFFLLTA